jgi:hypothetical protein
MEPQREQILQTLMGVARTMPAEQLREVADFADFLHERYRTPLPASGTPEALLRHAGSLRFESGEMDRLLEEINELRQMDI